MHSFYHLYYEALLRRFNGSDAELLQFQDRINHVIVGIDGENRVEREITDTFSLGDFIFCKNFQFLNEHGFPHQIDFIILTTHFLLIIEVKNISGELSYDKELRQFSRIRFDGKHEIFKNPFDQLKRHHEFLFYFLKNANYHIPIVSLIINANTNATFSPSLRGQPIIHISSLRSFIEEKKSRYPKIYTIDDMRNLYTFLEKNTVYYEAKRFVPIESVRPGVLCPSCQFKNVMHFQNRTWHCPSCNKNNRNALKFAIRDYRILVGEKITNTEFRQWTGLQNVVTASKILRRLNFPHTGANRNRVHIIPQSYMFL